MKTLLCVPWDGCSFLVLWKTWILYNRKHEGTQTTISYRREAFYMGRPK
jgi:hypothetical protein